MILSDKKIEEYIEKNLIEISPFDKELQLQKNSIDIRTSNRYHRYPKDIELEIEMLDPRNPYMNILEQDYISDKGAVLEPRKFFIVESLEYIKVPENIAIYIQPKFRLARMGLQIVNTGWIESGFEGNLEICIYNANEMPIRIFPEMRVCHIFFEEIK
ncbi:MAG: dCTP deaminase [Aquificae bacterium]|nr:dCTP deaminase [Aquificota bacterium]